MDNLWFEDELEPSLEVIKEQVLSGGENGLTVQELGNAARAIVRAATPDWEQLGKAPMTSGAPAVLWKVRLRCEFEPKSESSHFTLVRCESYLESLRLDEPVPTVYDLYPQHLYEGEPQRVSLKFSPKLTIAGVEVAVGEIDTDINIGQISPVVVGFFGEHERAPHWELRPTKHPLIGGRTFWLVIKQPEECKGIRLMVRVEGIIKTKWGPIAVYPRERVWSKRQSVVIQ